jgi:hypothetical protein
MGTNDFYDDRKFCTSCDDYVPYLASVERSYCVQCGGEVRLFSSEDWERFSNGLGNKSRSGRKSQAKSKTRTISDAKAQDATKNPGEKKPPGQQRKSA